MRSKVCPLSTTQLVFPFFGDGHGGGWVFVLKQVCLISVDITGYSDSPPTSLHSSDTKYGVRKSARRLGGKRHIPQNREKLHNGAWTF